MTLAKTLSTLAIAAAALPAAAAQFDFYKLNQPNNPALDFLPTNGIVCTTYDLCSSNVDGGVFGGTLNFVSDGITASATGSYLGETTRASAVQDSTKNWSASNGAGLGVYHQRNVTSDDNITFGEMLTITFDQAVTVTRIELRSEGHNYTNWTPGATFLLNGAQTALPQGTGYIDLNLTGTVFTFAFDGPAPALTNAVQSTGDQFYLAAMTVQAVPEPGTYAMLLAGLGALGFVARRRTKA